MNKQIIIVTGKSQSGKTSSVEHIINEINHSMSQASCLEYSFADPLKKFLIEVFNLDYGQCYGSDAEKNTVTKVQWCNLPLPVDEISRLYKESRPHINLNIDSFMTARELMQCFGSEVCRKMYNDCWANATLKKINKQNYTFNFISDCRFPNEVLAFKDQNPIVVRLGRNTKNSKHKSEIALDNFDFTQFKHYIYIDNDSLSLNDKNSLVWDSIKKYLGVII